MTTPALAQRGGVSRRVKAPHSKTSKGQGLQRNPTEHWTDGTRSRRGKQDKNTSNGYVKRGQWEGRLTKKWVPDTGYMQ